MSWRWEAPVTRADLPGLWTISPTMPSRPTGYVTISDFFISSLRRPSSKSPRTSTRATWSSSSGTIDEIVEWLESRWEREELQHGAALKRYVQTAWPDFDWEAAYKLFFAEYSQCCTVEQLAGTRALEMAARCVVETGTATFYRMMSDAEPRARAEAPGGRDQRRRGAPLQAFLPLFPALPGGRTAKPRRGSAHAPEPRRRGRGRGCLLCLQGRLPCLQSRRRVPAKATMRPIATAPCSSPRATFRTAWR